MVRKVEIKEIHAKNPNIAKKINEMSEKQKAIRIDMPTEIKQTKKVTNNHLYTRQSLNKKRLFIIVLLVLFLLYAIGYILSGIVITVIPKKYEVPVNESITLTNGAYPFHSTVMFIDDTVNITSSNGIAVELNSKSAKTSGFLGLFKKSVSVLSPENTMYNFPDSEKENAISLLKQKIDERLVNRMTHDMPSSYTLVDGCKESISYDNPIFEPTLAIATAKQRATQKSLIFKSDELKNYLQKTLITDNKNTNNKIQGDHIINIKDLKCSMRTALPNPNTGDTATQNISLVLDGTITTEDTVNDHDMVMGLLKLGRSKARAYITNSAGVESFKISYHPNLYPILPYKEGSYKINILYTK